MVGEGGEKVFFLLLLDCFIIILYGFYKKKKKKKKKREKFLQFHHLNTSLIPTIVNLDPPIPLHTPCCRSFGFLYAFLIYFKTDGRNFRALVGERGRFL